MSHISFATANLCRSQEIYCRNLEDIETASNALPL